MKSPFFKLFSIILISSLGLLVYSNTFHCAFQFDDHPSIVDNLAIRNVQDWQSVWNFLPRRFILYLSLAFNYSLGRLDVAGYHLFNLSIHLLSAILVWWFVLLTLSSPAMNEPLVDKNTAGKRSSQKQNRNQPVPLRNSITAHADLLALWAGLIFVAHPLQTEAVTYIVQRAASMSTLFYLATLCLYIKSRMISDKKPGTIVGKIYYAGALISAILAMFTKETAITVPLAILLYEFSFFRTKKEFKWQAGLPFLFTLLIIPVIMLLTETGASRLHVLRIEPGISPAHYLMTQFRVIVTYIRLAFVPFNQDLNYNYPPSQSLFELPTFSCLLFLTAILYTALRLFSKYRLIAFSIFWFFLTLLPESSIMPIKDVIFEHRMYLPMVGFSLFLVSGMFYLWGKNSLLSMSILLTIGIACISVLTYQRNTVWKNEFTLWNDSVAKSPDAAKPYTNRGNEYLKQGNYTKAMEDFNKALEINPHFAEAYNDRGLIFAKQGSYAQALSDYTKAIEIHDTFAEAYINRGIIYGNQGDLASAISDFTKAIEINPHMAGSYSNRGFALDKQGDLPGALADYNKALELNPKDARTYNNRGGVFVRKNDLAQALSDYNAAIELNPRYAESYNNRGLIYFRQNNLSQAITDFTKAIEIDPAYAESYNNRCSVYGKEGELERSISDCEAAIKIDPRFASSYNNLTITYWRLKQFAKAYSYAQKAQELGFNVDSGLLNAIKNALATEN